MPALSLLVLQIGVYDLERWVKCDVIINQHNLSKMHIRIKVQAMPYHPIQHHSNTISNLPTSNTILWISTSPIKVLSSR